MIRYRPHAQSLQARNMIGLGVIQLGVIELVYHPPPPPPFQHFPPQSP